jgi:hypothetical protein
MNSKLVKSGFLLNGNNDAASIKYLRKRLMVFLPLNKQEKQSFLRVAIKLNEWNFCLRFLF